MGPEWVYCFLSRREGDSEELVTTGGQTPEIESKIWWLFRALESGGDGFPADENPEIWVCVGVGDRVGLRGCSGAILNVGLGGAGCVCCLRTQ